MFYLCLMAWVPGQIGFYENRLIIVESNYFDGHPTWEFIFHFYESIKNLVYKNASLLLQNIKS